MNCINCKYREYMTVYQTTVCTISHRLRPHSCDYIVDDKDVENMNICFNCKHWLGGGDWGLSCAKDYYNCSVNGFDKACKNFNID